MNRRSNTYDRDSFNAGIIFGGLVQSDMSQRFMQALKNCIEQEDAGNNPREWRIQIDSNLRKAGTLSKMACSIAALEEKCSTIEGNVSDLEEWQCEIALIYANQENITKIYIWKKRHFVIILKECDPESISKYNALYLGFLKQKCSPYFELDIYGKDLLANEEKPEDAVILIF